MKTTVDTIAARELALYAENDGHLYRQMARPIISNLARKMRKGQYDAQKAVKALGALHYRCRSQVLPRLRKPKQKLFLHVQRSDPP